MAWQRFDQKYTPGQTQPFKLSRSKIDFYLECPRCFWLDRRLGIKRPDTAPFQINKAVDELLKKEFDSYRAKNQPHPWMVDNDIKAVPYAHNSLDDWRNNFTGVQTLHKATNFLVFGAVDDVWADESGQLIVVDYKATAKNKPINDLDPPGGWHDAYRRQMEVYQWLLRQNGFRVSDTGYFVYANGRLDLDGFFNKVEFVTTVIPYTGNADWVEATLQQIKDCLEADLPPVGNGPLGQGCSYCAYARSRTELTIEAIRRRK